MYVEVQLRSLIDPVDPADRQTQAAESDGPWGGPV